MLWEERACSRGVPVSAPWVLQVRAGRTFGTGVCGIRYGIWWGRTEMWSLRPAGAYSTYVRSRTMTTTVDLAGAATQGDRQARSAKRTHDAVLQGAGMAKGGGQAPKRSKAQEAKAKVQAAFDAVQRLGPSKGARRGAIRAQSRDRKRASLSAKVVAAAAAVGIAASKK